MLMQNKMGVNDVFSELKNIKHELSAILNCHCCLTIATAVTQFFDTVSDSPKAVLDGTLGFIIPTNKYCTKCQVHTRNCIEPP